MLAPLNVGMGQLIDQYDLRFARNDGIDVHLLEERTLVVELLARHCLETGGEFGSGLAAVGFDHPNHYILAAALAPDGLAQHGVGFANPGSIPEE